jgi:hypothetical protein
MGNFDDAQAVLEGAERGGVEAGSAAQLRRWLDAKREMGR